MENITGLRTVEWKNNKVIMIEQTKLPNELVFVEYDDFNQVANAIKTLIVRGAPAIGVSGAFGLGLAVLQSKAQTRDELLSDLENANTKIIQLINLKKNAGIENTENIENKENSYHISSFCEDDIQDELMAPDLDASDVNREQGYSSYSCWINNKLLSLYISLYHYTIDIIKFYKMHGI